MEQDNKQPGLRDIIKNGHVVVHSGDIEVHLPKTHFEDGTLANEKPLIEQFKMEVLDFSGAPEYSTVKALKKILEGLSDDTRVVLQKDPEGNSYEYLWSYDTSCVYDENEGQAYSVDYSADDHGLEEDDWAEMKKQPKVLVLAP